MNKTKMSLFIIFALFNLTLASTVTTVGTGREYTTISEALDALTPLAEDLTIYVTVPSSGIIEPLDISYEMTRGHSLEIRGERVAATETVYYFDDGVEFRLDEFMNTKTIEYIGEGLGRKITYSGRSSSGNQYYIKNHLGSTVMVTNNDGSEIIEVNDYLPYGKKINELESADDETYTFTGKELDKYDRDLDDNEDGEGLYYFGARYYDADIGLWTSVDPERYFYASYSYMGNLWNPITGIDPDGKRPSSTQKEFTDALYKIFCLDPEIIRHMPRTDENKLDLTAFTNASQGDEYHIKTSRGTDFKIIIGDINRWYFDGTVSGTGYNKNNKAFINKPINVNRFKLDKNKNWKDEKKPYVPPKTFQQKAIENTKKLINRLPEEPVPTSTGGSGRG